jgi:hypothetical protein
MEQPNLDTPGVIWDVHLAKLMSSFLALSLAKALPSLVALYLGWSILFAGLAGLKPALRAIANLRRQA